MRKTVCILLMVFAVCGGVLGQEMSAAGYIVENDFGKITYIFAHNEEAAEFFYNQVKNLFEGEDLYIYDSDDPSKQRQELIAIFADMREQFFYDMENNPENFTLIADVEEDKITKHQVIILSMSAFLVVTEFGLIDHLNFVFITTTDGGEVLLCNVEG